MTTFGGFPGVQITTQGGGISGVQVGAEEILVLFGKADTNNGTASANSPEQIGARQEADTKFGDGSELANAMKDALSNGANIDYLYGVAYDYSTDTTESFTSTSSGTLSNTPIEEESVSVSDGGGSVDNVAFYYGDGAGGTAPPQPSTSGTIFINPKTGEWSADASDDYDITYKVPDWSGAFSAANNTVSEDDTAVYAALTDTETVASTLSGQVTTLRGEYQMVKGVTGAQPNDTEAADADTVADATDLDPRYASANYTDAIDSDSMFLVAPARKQDTSETFVGAVGGLFAGHALTEPVYNDALSGFVDVEQKVSRSEAQDFRDEQVIPVRQAGSIRVKDNLSTSTEQDWERDFWRRRIVDRVILISKLVGEAIIGRINDDRTRSQAQTQLFSELDALVRDRLLEPNTDEETKWYVDVYESSTDADQVNIDVGITPQGIVKRIDETVTINT